MKKMLFVLLVICLSMSCISLSVTTYSEDDVLFLEYQNDKKGINKGIVVQPGTTIEIDFNNGDVTVLE